MGVRQPMLTDEQWEQTRPLIPPQPPKPKGGRPPAPDRPCLEGIRWILKPGAPLARLPEHPSPVKLDRLHFDVTVFTGDSGAAFPEMWDPNSRTAGRKLVAGRVHKSGKYFSDRLRCWARRIFPGVARSHLCLSRPSPKNLLPRAHVSGTVYVGGQP